VSAAIRQLSHTPCVSPTPKIRLHTCSSQK
jgi:hypothetical protein